MSKNIKNQKNIPEGIRGPITVFTIFIVILFPIGLLASFIPQGKPVVFLTTEQYDTLISESMLGDISKILPISCGSSRSGPSHCFYDESLATNEIIDLSYKQQKDLIPGDHFKANLKTNKIYVDEKYKVCVEKKKVDMLSEYSDSSMTLSLAVSDIALNQRICLRRAVSDLIKRK